MLPTPNPTMLAWDKPLRKSFFFFSCCQYDAILFHFFYHYLDDSNKVVDSFLLSSKIHEYEKCFQRYPKKLVVFLSVFRDTEFMGGGIYFSVIFVDILAFPVWL